MNLKNQNSTGRFYWTIFLFGETPSQKREVEAVGSMFSAMETADKFADELEWEVVKVTIDRQEEAPPPRPTK